MPDVNRTTGYVYMNRDCKFLFLSSHVTHTGTRCSVQWVDRDEAMLFRTDNVEASLKQHKAKDTIKPADIVATFEAEVIRTVNIIK